MAVSDRELRITARLINQASPGLRTLNRDILRTGDAGRQAYLKLFAYGAAFQTIGQWLRRFGYVALGAAAAGVKLGADFDAGMRLVRTQTQLTNREFDSMSSSVINMSVATGKSTKELSEGLFDIFSSIFVNAKEAKEMLGLFAKAAVAGQTDVRSAARGTIGIMNAFGLSAKDTSRVLDLQFNLVRFGVGTYEDFARAIGKLSPSVVAAGGTIETMTGLLAFTTRGGMNAANSVTSLARAYDLISRPKVVKALHKVLGVDAVDKATGKYKQLDQIVTEMATTGGLAKLSAYERKKVLQKIFGQGEIRANRFFNLAIPRFQDLNKVMGEVAGPGAAGALNRGFKEMSRSGRVVLDRLVASGKALLITLGKYLIPVVADIAKKFEGAVKWFRGLDDSTKSLIAKFLVFGGAAALVSGVIFGMLGQVLRFTAFFARAEIGVGALAGTLGKVVLVVGLLMTAFSDFLGISKGTTLKIVGVVLAFLALRKSLVSVGKSLVSVGAAVAGVGLKNFGFGLTSLLSPLNLVAGAITLVVTGILYWMAEAKAWRQHVDNVTTRLKSGALTVGDYKTAVRDMASTIEYGALRQKFMEQTTNALSTAQERATTSVNKLFDKVKFFNGLLTPQNRLLHEGQIQMVQNMIASGNFAGAMNYLKSIFPGITAAVKAQGQGYDALSRNGNDAAAATGAVTRATQAIKGILKNTDVPLQNTIERYRNIARQGNAARDGVRHFTNAQKEIKQAAINSDQPMINLANRYAAIAREADKAANAAGRVKGQLSGSPYGWYFHVAAQRATEYARAVKMASSAGKMFVSPKAAFSDGAPQRVSVPSGGGGGGGMTVNVNGAKPTAQEIISELDWHRRTRGW